MPCAILSCRRPKCPDAMTQVFVSVDHILQLPSRLDPRSSGLAGYHIVAIAVRRVMHRQPTYKVEPSSGPWVRIVAIFWLSGGLLVFDMPPYLIGFRSRRPSSPSLAAAPPSPPLRRAACRFAPQAQGFRIAGGNMQHSASVPWLRIRCRTARMTHEHSQMHCRYSH